MLIVGFTNPLKRYTMKFLFLLVLLPMAAASQYCTSGYDRWFNIKAGAPYSASVDCSFEWFTFGVGAGVKVWQTEKRSGKFPGDEDARLAPYVKGNINFVHKGSFRVYIEGYAGWKFCGGGIKLGWLLTDDWMIIVYPQYNTELKKQIDAGIGLRF